MRKEVADSYIAVWNRYWPIGTHVIVINDLGVEEERVTWSEPWVVGIGDNASPLVGVSGRTGGYLLTRIVPISKSTP